MKRPLVAALALVGLAVVSAAVYLLSRDDGPQGAPTERTLVISTALSPRVHLFGDPVVAEVRLFFDRRRVRADTVRVSPIFRPYEAGTPARSRSDSGQLTQVRYRYSLRCLARACAPRGARRERQLPAVRVFYFLRDERTRAAAVAEWPSLTATSRLGAADLQQPRWRADLRRLPEPAYAFNPAGLAALLLALAVGLLVLSWTLGRRAIEWSAAGAEADDRPARAPLAEAVALVRDACSDGFTPRARLALERLARELERAGHGRAGGDARRLAWSPERPSQADVERLAQEVERMPETDE
jgi:hypothetical protein